jgi:hypothetical protein
MKKIITIVISMAIVIAICNPAKAESLNTSSQEEKVAADLANPLSPITTANIQYRAQFGVGPDDDINQQVRLQPSLFKPLSDRSAFLVRTIVPFSFQEFPTAKSGMGDITLVPYYVPDMTKSTFIGYGTALGLPTAIDDSLGSEKWTAGPALLLAKVGQPITSGFLSQHVWSYAGDDNRGDISASTIQPFITYLLGGGWAASVLSETTYNWEAEEDEWTIPVQLGISKVVGIGGQYVNVGFTSVTYVEGSDHLPDWEFRANLTYVFR